MSQSEAGLNVEYVLQTAKENGAAWISHAQLERLLAGLGAALQALERADLIVSEAHDVLWASFDEWEGDNGRREPLNAKMWELHNLIRPVLAAVGGNTP